MKILFYFVSFVRMKEESREQRGTKMQLSFEENKSVFEIDVKNVLSIRLHFSRFEMFFHESNWNCGCFIQDIDLKPMPRSHRSGRKSYRYCASGKIFSGM